MEPATPTHFLLDFCKTCNALIFEKFNDLILITVKTRILHCNFKRLELEVKVKVLYIIIAMRASHPIVESSTLL